MALADHAPEPPVPLPPARTVQIPGRGEFFLRDSGELGGERPALLLLHGWLATADLNFAGVYDELIAAGHRVIALDHRGHGRGLRPLVQFRLSDCAADAAAVVRALGAVPVIAIGYSMGGAIAQLLARDHPDVLAGLILGGTAQHWREPALKGYWWSMGAFGFGLALFPSPVWSWGFRRVGFEDGPMAAWLHSELLRHDPRGVAEAGRELGRFDSRSWLRPLDVPAAVVLTSRDSAVPPRKQRELARALAAPVFEAPIDHLEVTTAPDRFNPALMAALASVIDERRAVAA